MIDDVLKLAARSLLAVPFLVTGATKLADPSGIARMLGALNLPAPEVLGWLVGLCEVVAGLALVACGLLLVAAKDAGSFSLVSFSKPEKRLAQA